MARRPTREELELWRSAMAGVRRLPGAGQEHELPPGERPPEGFAEAMTRAMAPPAAAQAAAQAAAPAATVSKQAAPGRQQPPPTPALTPGTTAGVDRRTAERVRKGRLPVEATLDLHGLRQAEAHHALAGFVARCHGDGRRLVLVVTGKGTFRDNAGILRAQVPRWLNEPGLRDKVLSLHPAQPRHGGAGAFYLFLKRRRER